MNRIYQTLFIFAVVFSASFASAQTLSQSPLLFISPRAGERLRIGEAYDIRLSRNPGIPGVYSLRTGEGLLVGNLVGSSTPSSILWTVGKYAGEGDEASVLAAGTYQIVYVGAGNKILAKTPMLYLEHAVSTSTPVASFSFENSSVDAVSGKILEESAGVSYEQGLSGRGMGFDGRAGLAAGEVPGVNLSREELTISLWVKPVAGRRPEIAHLAGVWPEASGYPAYALSLERGYPRFDVGGRDGVLRFKGSESLKTDKWSHVAVSLRRNSSDGLSAKLYVNGTEQVVFRTPQNLDASFAPGAYVGTFAVGGDPVRKLASFAGVLDELRVYNAPMTAAEVTAVYERERPDTPIRQQFFVANLAKVFLRPVFTLFGF